MIAPAGDPYRAAALTDAEGALAHARARIEAVDADLVALVAERVRWSEVVGAAKRALGRPTLDPAREAAVVRRAGELARAAGLDDEAVRALFWQLMAIARRAQVADAPRPDAPRPDAPRPDAPRLDAGAGVGGSA